MTDTDASALRALGEAELHALADIVLADFENSDGSNETVLQMCGRIIAGGFRRDPDLLDELDRLRGQVAPCDGGCDYSSGPEETCSLHGRKVAEVWEIVEQLQGQVARVEALHRPDWSDWGSDHPEEGASCSCGVDHDHADCPTVQALAIPADVEGGE